MGGGVGVGDGVATGVAVGVGNGVADGEGAGVGVGVGVGEDVEQLAKMRKGALRSKVVAAPVDGFINPIEASSGI